MNRDITPNPTNNVVRVERCIETDDDDVIDRICRNNRNFRGTGIPKTSKATRKSQTLRIFCHSIHFIPIEDFNYKTEKFAACEATEKPEEVIISPSGVDKRP